MGQCASRKGVGAVSNSSTGRPMAAPDMNPNFKRQYYTDDNQNQDDNNREHSRRSFTRGVRTSFGFKRPSSAIPLSRETTNNRQQVHPVDNNGNDDNLDSPDSDIHTSGRTTPRLAPPKKEANATRLNRFGFRNTANVNRTRPATTTGIINNNVEKDKPKKSVSIAPSVPKSKLTNNKTTVNSKIKSSSKVTSPSQPTAPTKYTFHSTQLPRPQLPVRVVESKNAKTAANINRKVSSASQRSDEAAFSSKEGSVTEDSGVGSHTSGTNSNFTGDSDTLHGVELMDSSPTFGRRKTSRSRNLELVVSGKNFDIRDLDDSVEDGVVTEVAVIPLPRLPSVFANNSSDARNTNVFGNVSTGMVRERTLEFERQIDKNRRKISVTSSEGCSEDYGEEEKSFRDRSSNEKTGQAVSRLYSSTKPYRESHTRKPKHSDKDSSPTSSDDQDWELGGEAMAEVCSIGFSSSDESREKEISPLLLRPSFIKSNNQSEQMSSSCTGAIPKDSSRSVLHSRDEIDRPGESLRHSLIKTNIPSESSYHMSNSAHGARSVLLTIEEPKYTSLSQICPPRPLLTSSMMTSSSSLSSSTSSAAKDYLKSSLFMMDDTFEIKKPTEFPSSMSNLTLTNNSATSTPKDNLKSVLLSIEDPKFAAVAASSSGNLLDDETSPVDSLISSYTESEEIISKNKAKTSKSSTDSKDVNEKSPLSPESPGTPTNASLSLSEGRDFLIDDEIADQPALMFNDTIGTINSIDRMRHETSHNLSMFSDISLDRVNSEHQNISDSVATLVDSTPKLSRKILRSCEGSPALARAKNPLLSRAGSVDTLSPCESIASDDLMMDFDHSQSSGIEDSTDRLHLNESGALHSLDEETLRSELENQDAVVARQWSSLLGTQSNKDSPPYSMNTTPVGSQSHSYQCNGAIPRTSSALKRVRAEAKKQSNSAGNTPTGSPVLARSRGRASVVRTNNFLRSRTNTPSSVPDSPRSLDRAGLRNSLTSANSPLLRSARTTHGSPAAYDSDDSSRLDRVSHGSMVNDIVGIKTMLHKLKRVLQETEEDNLMRTEPLNPFDNQSLKNGLYNGLNNEQSDLDSVDSMDLTSSPALEMTELRRQIEFLQSQLEDRDRTVHQLQNQISKYNLDKHQREAGDSDLETCNAATQTDRVRPLSAGPSLLQTLPPDGGMGPLVSANETNRRSRPQSMVESHSRTPPLKLWRKPGEPPPPTSRYSQPSALPRRTRSRSRPTASAS